MFDRPDHTYKLSNKTIRGVMSDKAGPLYNIVEDIPANSKVLDIGAGNGLLAMLFEYIKKKVVIDGVEPNVSAARIAKKSYRNFYVGYVQDYLLNIKMNNYDYVVLADVIEHTQDPVKFLKEIVDCVTTRTKIIISTPNVAFGSIRLALLEGRFDYVDSGLLEKTHIRFFTKSTLEKTIQESGLGFEKVVYLNRRFDHTEVPVDVKKNFLSSIKLTKDELASTYQFYLITSKKSKEHSMNKHGNVGDNLKTIDIVKSILR